MKNQRQILAERIEKARAHYVSLKSYHEIIQSMAAERDIFNERHHSMLPPEKKAIFDAYLKRFASLQDYLGSQVFPLLLEVSGIGTGKMTEVLTRIEKEGIIDSLENWIELRELRNKLEHEYPNELQDALDDLRTCVNRFEGLVRYFEKADEFASRYLR